MEPAETGRSEQRLHSYQLFFSNICFYCLLQRLAFIRTMHHRVVKLSRSRRRFSRQVSAKRASLVAHGKEHACQCRRCGFHPSVGKIPWRRHGNPCQYSCLENFMDRGAWQIRSMGSQRVGQQLTLSLFPIVMVFCCILLGSYFSRTTHSETWPQTQKKAPGWTEWAVEVLRGCGQLLGLGESAFSLGSPSVATV